MTSVSTYFIRAEMFEPKSDKKFYPCGGTDLDDYPVEFPEGTILVKSIDAYNYCSNRKYFVVETLKNRVQYFSGPVSVWNDCVILEPKQQLYNMRFSYFDIQKQIEQRLYIGISPEEVMKISLKI
jgi:galactokinase/mevalonate kinase-like predicted kinase